MKKIIGLLSLGVLLLNCNSKPVEKPDNLVSKEEMINILYDLYVVNAMKSTELQFLQDRGITAADYVYKKYKIDSLQFATSDRYYASDVDEYENIYKEVTERLKQNKAEIDSLLLKNPEVEVSKDSTKTDPTRFKLKDSVKKKSTLKRLLVNDSIKNQ